jgi:hypothetical protein
VRFATAYTYTIYIWHPFFFWWGTYRANMLHDIIHSYSIEKQILKHKRNLKSRFQFKDISQESFQPQSFLLLMLKFWVITLLREFMKFLLTLILIISFGLASSKPKFWSRWVSSFGSNRNFRQYRQLSTIVTSESLVRLRHMGSRQKAEIVICNEIIKSYWDPICFGVKSADFSDYSKAA